jgi:hypothetical protein
VPRDPGRQCSEGARAVQCRPGIARVAPRVFVARLVSALNWAMSRRE